MNGLVQEKTLTELKEFIRTIEQLSKVKIKIINKKENDYDNSK